MFEITFGVTISDLLTGDQNHGHISLIQIFGHSHPLRLVD